MKTIKILLTLIFIGTVSAANAQFFKKLAKKAEKAAERTVERRVEKESQKETDKALDEVFEGKEEKKKRNKKSKDPVIGTSDDNTSQNSTDVKVERASDFEPGAVTIFEDDFSRDNQGDFPAKWDTNGSGEIVVIEGKKWFRIGGKSLYVPMIKETLPENYTIEFDMYTVGLDRQTSSQSWIELLLHDSPRFERSTASAMIKLSPCQFINSPGYIEKRENGKRVFWNEIGKDYRDLINGKLHIAIAVNGPRMRLWMNDNKLIDVPRMVPATANKFKLFVRGLRDDTDKDEVYITNFRVGKAGVDNRSKLITEGRLSTNAIQFKSGSDALLTESYKTIREIAQVLEDNADVRIKIIGHTDSDGSESSNLELSKERAKAVKNSLINQYGIAADRITTDGKGESDPVASNDTSEGKAQNRRVEFIKL
ncbi:OmpA family protein [Aquimarina brevivitae]|uniref:OmpA family protein n=1 Tax=Aquimarina brevivitae TaxID=323412 RepID=A0A4Q7P151_9FLAO|nr:OmpA family protein [Aquimarina brevivitae]RZS93435.1 OmpA family protein [Aquimarina brevivitae]